MSMSDDNAGNLINLLLAAEAAGIYDLSTGTWTGPKVPSDPVTFVLTYDTAGDTVPAATYAAPTQTGSITALGGDVTSSSPYGLTTSAEWTTLLAMVTDSITDIASTNTKLAALAADVLALKDVIVALVNVVVAAGIAL